MFSCLLKKKSSASYFRTLGSLSGPRRLSISPSSAVTSYPSTEEVERYTKRLAYRLLCLPQEERQKWVVACDKAQSSEEIDAGKYKACIDYLSMFGNGNKEQHDDSRYLMYVNLKTLQQKIQTMETYPISGCYRNVSLVNANASANASETDLFFIDFNNDRHLLHHFHCYPSDQLLWISKINTSKTTCVSLYQNLAKLCGQENLVAVIFYQQRVAHKKQKSFSS
ncbi:hypothetical protein RFI_14815, partial [Reticulomyxa filosa]